MLVLLVLLVVGSVSAFIFFVVMKKEVKAPADQSHFKPTISQGLVGKITRRTGNCMPVSGGKAGTETEVDNCASRLIYREPLDVIIKRPLDLKDKENKEIVKKIAGVRGEFQVELEPGLYNMYVMYEGKEYCNLFGGNQRGEDCEFTVKPGELTNYKFVINDAVD